jgi:hypothetical protein
VEEWDAHLTKLLKELDRLDANQGNTLRNRLADFEREHAKALKQWEVTRKRAYWVQVAQRNLLKRHGKLAKSANNLLRVLRYGKALLASDKDLANFEAALKRRKTRLRVAKLRKKQKTVKGVIYDIPIPLSHESVIP